MLAAEELTYDKESLKTEHETLRNTQDIHVENVIVKDMSHNDIVLNVASILDGDLRKILPIILKATRPIVVGATINSSYLWTNCKVLRLTNNLRLQSLASEEDRQAVDWFSIWIADIEYGITGVVNDDLSEISDRFLLKCGHDLIATIVESTFQSAGYDMLDESHLEGRAIISLALDVVDQINQYICDMNITEYRTYLSCDSLCKAELDRKIYHNYTLLNS
ncbi:PREDICTED: uncharacterized protein LOC109173689 [Ipomoea nil]|uniref:uncharacterized protein LOC109173689 n=1 Tax=Ipomoea nil TaxID=35883 RepID=UPI00090167D5|nr:PREDICTED: uncharacterized protein LOC109173689 [Ipomoea nil]